VIKLVDVLPSQSDYTNHEYNKPNSIVNRLWVR